MSKLLGALFIFLVIPSTFSITDRRCGSDVTRLWLDVVIVIDNSRTMNMNLVYDTISGLFDYRMQIGTGYIDPRSTRVGFITYNYNATDVADFYKLQSWSDLNSQIQRLRITPQSNSDSSKLDNALVAAANMINSTAGYRDNFKKVVIVFTSVHGSYNRNPPKDVSKYLKSKGVNVITVNTGSSRDVSSYLQAIASSNMNFAIADGNATQEILKAMTDTNCYCPRQWFQYQWPFDNDQNRYGTCVISPNWTATRDSAKAQCHSTNMVGIETNGVAYLVNELDLQKRAFNFEYLRNITGQPINAFYNGLISLNNAWYWDQPTGTPMLGLDPNSGAPPARSACVADMKYSDGTTAWTPVSCGNSFKFICERVSCDTDNYCG